MLEMESQMEAMREEQQEQRLSNIATKESVVELAAEVQILCNELELVKSRQALGETRSGEVAALEVKYTTSAHTSPGRRSRSSLHKTSS